MKFSQKVKSELEKIRETGKEYKQAFAYGMSYATQNVETTPKRAAQSLIRDSVLSAGEEIGGIFLRGVFIACGSITDPQKDYHLELVPPYREKCEELLEFMSDYGLKMKMSQRVSKNNCEAQSFVYCKSCEQIIDFLTFIGATRHSMELMNVTILKEIRNNVNRAVNCESANLDKTARAASKHIANIDYIFSEKGAEYLPEHLRRVAELRKNSVGLSLEEIGRMLTPAISKSGVNHRLNKINGIADKLRNEILEKA